MAQPTAAQDAEKLNGAVKKDDKKTIIGVLADRNNAQRVAIKQAYKDQYKKELDEVIPQSGYWKSGRDFRQLVSALLKTRTELLVDELHHAIKGPGTDEEALIEILCTKEPDEITKINEAYKSKYKTELENDITGETSGHFQRVLLGVLKANRTDPAGSTPKQDAQDLYQAGENQWGTNEKVFIGILTSRPFPWIRQIYQEYTKISERNLCDAISSEMSGNLKKSLLAIVKSAFDIAMYFAECIEGTMKGFGTNDRALIRLIVSRCEIDLRHIVEAYQKMYGKTLIDRVKEDTTGEYRDLLVAVIAQSKK